MFSLAALEVAAAARGSEEDLPDAFYDLTAADVQRQVAAQRQRQAYNEAGLRTKARCVLTHPPPRRRTHLRPSSLSGG